MMFKLSRYTARQRHSKPLQTQNRVYAPNESIYRFWGNFLLLAVIGSVMAIIITIRDDLINKKIDSYFTEFFAYSVRHGWAIDDILIEGRHKTNLEELNRQINLTRSDNVLQVDLAALQEKVKELPWVEKAEIRRTFFPNVIHIKLWEKDVLALWQYGSKFYPVDLKGNLIDAEYVPHKPILVIVGRKAPEKIVDLLKEIDVSPELLQRVKAAVLFSGRRWDVIFDDIEHGITVKLPEKDIQKTWQKFIKINNQHGLLKRKLTIIDLRYENKISVTVGNSD